MHWGLTVWYKNVEKRLKSTSLFPDSSRSKKVEHKESYSSVCTSVKFILGLVNSWSSCGKHSVRRSMSPEREVLNIVLNFRFILVSRLQIKQMIKNKIAIFRRISPWSHKLTNVYTVKSRLYKDRWTRHEGETRLQFHYYRREFLFLFPVLLTCKVNNKYKLDPFQSW